MKQAKLELEQQQTVADAAAAAAVSAAAAEQQARAASQEKEDALGKSQARIQAMGEDAARLQAAVKEARERVGEEQEARVVAERKLDDAQAQLAQEAAMAESLRTEADERAEAMQREIETARRDKAELLSQVAAANQVAQAAEQERLQQASQVEELKLHKEKLQEHAHKLHVQMNDLQAKARLHAEANEAVHIHLLQTWAIVETLEQQQHACVEAVEGELQEVNTLRRMLALARQACSARDNELKWLRKEAEAGKREIEMVKGAYTEGEQECLQRLKAIADADVRSELLLVGLANVRLREQLSVRDSLRLTLHSPNSKQKLASPQDAGTRDAQLLLQDRILMLENELSERQTQVAELMTKDKENEETEREQRLAMQNAERELARQSNQLTSQSAQLTKLATALSEAEAAAEEALQRLQDERREREMERTQREHSGAQAQRVDGGTQTEKDEVSQVAVLRAQLADKDETMRMLKESKKQLAGDLSSLECLARQVIASPGSQFNGACSLSHARG